MTENKKNQEFKIRQIRGNIEYSFRGSDRYFDLFVVFFVAGLLYGPLCMFFSVSVLIRGWLTRNYLIFVYVECSDVCHSVYVMCACSWFSCCGFSVAVVRNNIWGCPDIPAETPYAPGEQFQGGE